jgi:nitroreductase
MHNINEFRKPDTKIDNIFTERWSIRSFSEKTLNSSQISKLFESARWAPSSSNRQPWHFIYSTSGKSRVKMNNILNEGNRIWAIKAPLLIFVYTKLQANDGETNFTAQFDAGAAWMSLAIQARLMGLYTHAMGGIDRSNALELVKSDNYQYQSICAVAVGYLDESKIAINPDEIPNQRISVSEFVKKL